MDNAELFAYRENEAAQQRKLGLIAFGVSVGSLAMGTVLEERGFDTNGILDGIGIGAMYFAMETRNAARKIMTRAEHERDFLSFNSDQ